jgi:hypothetical protein
MRTATWTHANGCPELGLEPGKPFTTRCPSCGVESQTIFNGAITSRWDGATRIATCDNCGREAGAWTEDYRRQQANKQNGQG